MPIKDDIKPITYLKNHTAELIRDVVRESRTVTITQNGEAKVVVMDVARYDQLRQALALLKLISLGEADIAAGRTLTMREAFARAEAAIDRATPDE